MSRYWQNASPIGSTNFAGGFAAGALAVPTSALTKNQLITATQIKMAASVPPGPHCLLAAAQIPAFESRSGCSRMQH
jgi:hypothetical protein